MYATVQDLRSSDVTALLRQVVPGNLHLVVSFGLIDTARQNLCAQWCRAYTPALAPGPPLCPPLTGGDHCGFSWCAGVCTGGGAPFNLGSS